MPSWDPGQYGRFEAERLRPAIDLIDRVRLDAPATIHDLGCGPGNITALIAARWPDAHVTGVDSSPDMLARAREESAAIEWVEVDIADWRPPKPADLVYANASLHWLADHATLFPQLLGALAPGSALAVQMPRNFAMPSHRCMEEAAAAGPWRGRMRERSRFSPVPGPAVYYDILAPHTRTLDIWETEYLHVLEGENPVVEWTKGTGLRPYLDVLADDAERETFLADYAARIARAYPPQTDGKTLFPFRRIFMVATV